MMATTGGLLAGFDTALTTEQEAAYQQWRSRLPDNLQGDADYDLRGAFLANASAESNGHLTDEFKKPNHMTFSDGSRYSAPQQQGGRWVEDGNGGWGFWASPFNVEQHGMTGISEYFRNQEPGSTVIFPSGYRMPRAKR